MKKKQRQNITWTLAERTSIKSSRRKHCTLAVWPSKLNFAPPQTPFRGARDGQNLISWRWSLSLPTNPVWRGSMHAISSYRGNRPTNTQTQTLTGAIIIHCSAPQLSARCNKNNYSIPLPPEMLCDGRICQILPGMYKFGPGPPPECSRRSPCPPQSAETLNPSDFFPCSAMSR